MATYFEPAYEGLPQMPPGSQDEPAAVDSPGLGPYFVQQTYFQPPYLRQGGYDDMSHGVTTSTTDNQTRWLTAATSDPDSASSWSYPLPSGCDRRFVLMLAVAGLVVLAVYVWRNRNQR